MTQLSVRHRLLPVVGTAAVVHPDDDAIHRQLNDILSRSEFAAGEDPWAGVREFFARFFSWLSGLGDSSPVLFWLLLVSLVILLILLVSHIGWTVARVVRPKGPRSPDEDLREQRTRRSIAYRQEAARRAEQGEFTEAIRFLFLSLVYRFDESGRVSFLKAYTNREYLSLFQDRPAVYRDLKVFVDTLDDHWYGQRPSERGRYEACLALYESLQAP